MTHGYGRVRGLRWRHSLVCCLFLPALAFGEQLELRFKGDFPALRENAEAFLGKVEGRSAEGLRRFASHGVDQVSQALRALGYYNPEIDWQVTDEDIPRLVLTVDPGKPVRISSRTVRILGPASGDPGFQAIPVERLKTGDVLSHADYQAVKGAITNLAQRRGYFDGSFTTSRLKVDPEALTADIDLIYQSGERYRLGDVEFAGGDELEEDLLRRFINFEPGTAYHADKVARLNSNLSNSGYFSQVVVDASPQDAVDRTIPVTVRLSHRDRRSVAAGIGFSTDIGPRLTGTWTEHWVNPMGHRRGAKMELAAPRQTLSGWYELPLDPPMSDSIRLTGGYLREDIEDIESERLTLGQQWQHALDNGWEQILSLRLEGERFQIGDETTDTSRLLLPGASYSRLSADSPLDPSRGYRLGFEVTGAHRGFFSDADIVQVIGFARGIITLGDGHRFLARAKAGAVGSNEFSDVPPSLRFFAGGDQSVRGYDFESLSPENSEGTGVGGKYLFAGSLEYQFPITESWRLAAFVDEGNAINDLSDKLATGAGVGIRWISPVGPLRLDVAKGLDEDLGGSWRLHFSMGPEL
ncbi:autotransporter assembly complex family protein [Marinobacter sp.]|uniref:autotransporter assembly complex protein TamA n=1 Tax=Marinobacter sp. TaxID=50741 RepID=UPI00384EE0BA